MISAKLDNNTRKKIYRRDGFRCALCDSTRYLQIHHAIPRGQGGSDHPHNLITLCSRCHNQAHGLDLLGTSITEADIELACVEYLSDLYAGEWYPFK